jgi:hypothetical protein
MTSTMRILGVVALMWAATQLGRADDFVLAPTGSASYDIEAGTAAPGSNRDGCDPLPGALDCDCWQPKWTVDLGAVFLHHGSPDPLQIIHPIGSSATLSDASDFHFDTFAAGPDITLARTFQCGCSFEVRYFGALEWTANQNYGAAGNFQLGSISNFGATGLTAQYLSQLENIEANWLCPIGDRFTFLAGFRNIRLHDELSYNVVFPAFGVKYDWDEENMLYGGQLGGLLNLWRLDGPFSLNCGFEAGVYNNSASNSFNLLPTTGGSFPGGALGRQTAFVGEIDVTAVYQLTRHIALQGGYRMLWADGLALATDQAAVATANGTQNGLTTTGNVFYNGATADIEFRW